MAGSEFDREVPITVVETRGFIRDIGSVLTADELSRLIWELASNPERGVIIPGTGGVRKVRWAIKGRGKRGGARVVYFYHDDRMPVFLLAAFAKSAKVDLSQAEKQFVRKLVRQLVSEYVKQRTR